MVSIKFFVLYISIQLLKSNLCIVHFHIIRMIIVFLYSRSITIFFLINSTLYDSTVPKTSYYSIAKFRSFERFSFCYFLKKLRSFEVFSRFHKTKTSSAYSFVFQQNEFYNNFYHYTKFTTQKSSFIVSNWLQKQFLVVASFPLHIFSKYYPFFMKNVYYNIPSSLKSLQWYFLHLQNVRSKYLTFVS